MSAAPELQFSLNPLLDRASLKATFERCGRVEIRDFLLDGQAEALRQHLLARPDWTLVLNGGDKVFEIPRHRFNELSQAQLEQLDQLVAKAAKDDFQYRYETIRVADEPGRRSADDALSQFVEFMGSDPVLLLFREVTGSPDIIFADGQATAYSSGHFLTKHDDDVENKHRRAAYVFGLAPRWKADWGGLLMFHASDGNIEEAFTPAMGALRIFAVPCPHSVSYVTPFAPEPRLSVTGWLRTARPN